MVSPGSSIKKTDRHDILVTEILLKVALNTIKQTVCRRILPIESTFAYNSILIYIYISLIYKNYRIQQIVFLLYNMYSNKRYVILTKRKINKALNKQENQRLCNIDKKWSILWLVL